MSHDLELLAPAGDWASLEAALDAGADAVYLGLRTLNARRRAKNFSPDQFVKAVEAAHAKGVKVYLTLNIDLAQRELGQAARILELARQCRADAVLVRDPALLAFRPEYPEIEFHMSTQTCMANTADVAAAAELGADRVVLAREMTLGEIAAASAGHHPRPASGCPGRGVKTEVFVQGALCFSVSGRCLLSSWAGGRSGNRGACTSPCRVPWTAAESPLGTPLSMKDLSLIDRLPELRRAGVAALKIEGRLKNAAWVSRAVSLFKRALAVEEMRTEHLEKGPVPIFSEEAKQLGLYTGRTLTNAYLDGIRNDLTAQAEGRQSSTIIPDESDAEPSDVSEDETINSAEEQPTYDLQLLIEPKGIACSCVCGLREEKWTIPKTVIRRPHKAVAIGSLFDQLDQGTLQGFQLGRRETNDAEFLLTPRAVNALIDRISAAIRLAQKSPDELVRIDLPTAVSNLLAQKKGTTEKTGTGPFPDMGPVPVFSANRLCLGKKPDRARLDAKDAPAFLQHVRPKGVIVEGLAANTLGRIRAMCENVALIAALPQVFFEDDIPQIKKLLTECVQKA